ncbi:MAG: hypothetical protein DRJ02_03445 [Bacteroidetes bacterium]|nr:MAG: hypothetical protein DRI72_08060 [Bacteroidota bacterium]RLD88646.1 MAG: hypothetical protein DRJ02_03445 [Bacteroidota bacterium]
MASDYDSIRPYRQDEIPEALKRILANPTFQNILDFLFPGEDQEALKEIIANTKSREEFHKNFMVQVISSIAEKTSDQLTFSGIDQLEKDKGYIFVANHRDIILDSSFLALGLVKHGLISCEITWGDNLMISPFIVDLGKVNGMITVFREGSPKEMLRNSQILSSYIRESVTERKQSVWIAQRKGRTKDGTDKTDPSILKMLSLSGQPPPPGSLKNLNITPVSISYEWEPCDIMKVRELYISQQTTYVKQKDEDLQSIIGGVAAYKGKIHLTVGNTVERDFDNLDTSVHNNLILEQVAHLIDKQIYASYKLWPPNYLAYDLLENTNKFANKYDKATIRKFNEKLEELYKAVDGPEEDLKHLFLKLYANPVYNKEM